MSATETPDDADAPQCPYDRTPLVPLIASDDGVGVVLVCIVCARTWLEADTIEKGTEV